MGDYWLNPPYKGKQSKMRKATPPKRKNPNDKGCALTALALAGGLATGGAGVIYGVVQGIRAVIG